MASAETYTIKMYRAKLLRARDTRVTRETLIANNMASNADSVSETVALALCELALSRGDQDRLSEFITD